jgi:hypothetical protein
VNGERRGDEDDLRSTLFFLDVCAIVSSGQPIDRDRTLVSGEHRLRPHSAQARNRIWVLKWGGHARPSIKAAAPNTLKHQ